MLWCVCDIAFDLCDGICIFFVIGGSESHLKGCLGPMNGTLSFYECRLSGGDIQMAVGTPKPYLLLLDLSQCTRWWWGH